LRSPAEHTRCGPRVRAVSRVRAGNEAAGVCALAERARCEHRELQCRRGDRAGPRAHGDSDRVELLAHAVRVPRARVRDQCRGDGLRLSAGGVSALRLFPCGMTMTSERELTLEARQKIAVAAGAALLGAGLILVMFVLPAEYGVDPLGTGAR